jgi:hypothetical protein
MGLVNVSVLGCVGARIAIGHWLANRSLPLRCTTHL